MQDKTAEHCDWMDDGGFIQHYRAVGVQTVEQCNTKKSVQSPMCVEAGVRAWEEAGPHREVKRSPQAELET